MTKLFYIKVGYFSFAILSVLFFNTLKIFLVVNKTYNLGQLHVINSKFEYFKFIQRLYFLKPLNSVNICQVLLDIRALCYFD